MKAMELKVWVDGVQRIVCGVTEFTTCQEVVIALAQAIGRTGRYTLIEKWRDTERHLSPQEFPVVSLNKWGQYASDVQLILQRTGPSLSERPTSDFTARIPERGFYRQSLPPLAKLRPFATERSLRRKEPKRKSLTFSGGARGLREIFGKSKDSEAKQTQQRGVNLNLSRVLGGSGLSSLGGSGVSSAPVSPSRELSRLVQRQRERLQALEGRLQGCEDELRDCEDAIADGQQENLEEDLSHLEQQLRSTSVELEEEYLWEHELQMEQETEQKLCMQLTELQSRVSDCEAKLKEYLTHIQTLETSLDQERQQHEAELNQKLNEEEAQVQLEMVCSELEAQSQNSSRLERSCRALESALCQASRKIQEKEQELEQLTKELRQVNLQQFIQQTGTKVTVLPAQSAPETGNEEECGSLKLLGSSRLLPTDLRTLQSPVSTSFNPEGIYV
ncbi:ras association domain-containing protein 8-like [Eucyclogobius newberryi]|uniref:ras association domain-containing protein 8-like n=1 Tax=Eucyclogobius newberryi TaxID=166745 RepID=UPI003B5C2DA7